MLDVHGGTDHDAGALATYFKESATRKVHLFLFGMVLGVVLAVHLAMNGKVGAAINNPRVGNALFWCIGAVGALAIGLICPLAERHPDIGTISAGAQFLIASNSHLSFCTLRG